MPRIFDDTTRNAIREKLIAAGKDHFARFGLRKTRVEELAQAVGIAKGTFYGFFESKEDLCITILHGEEENRLRRMREIFSRVSDPRTALIEHLLEEYSLVFENSLISQLIARSEIELLFRRVSDVSAAEHMAEDVGKSRALIDLLNAAGCTVAVSPEILTGILRMLAMSLMQGKAPIGENFNECMRFVVEAIADRICGPHSQPAPRKKKEGI